MLIQKMSQLPLLKSIPKLIAVDTETENKSGGIEGYSFSYLSKNKKLKGYYIPINHLFGDDEKYVNVNFNSGVKYLEQLVKGRRVVFHNAQFDLTILEEECGIQIPNEMVEDTLLIHWLLDTERLHGLKPIMRDEYGQNVVTYDEARAQSFAEFAKYGSNDSIYTLWLFYKIYPEIKALKNTFDLYRNVEIPNIRPLQDINHRKNFIRIDQKLMKSYYDLIHTEQDAIQSILTEKLGDINYRSTKQLAEKLIEFGYNIPRKPPTSKMIATARLKGEEVVGNYSLDAKQLDKIHKKQGGLILSAILYNRKIEKIENTYVRPIYESLQMVKKGVYVLSGYDIMHTGTRTGRYCVPLESEILTIGGWKKYNEISVGDVVMGFDLTTYSYRWTILEDINVFMDKQPIGRLSVGRLHNKKYQQGFWCTEEHRWIVKNDKVIGFANAGKIPNNMKVLYQPKDVLMPSISDDKYINVSSEEAAIIGWYLTDGNLTKSKGSINPGLAIRLCKKRSIAQLDLLMKKFDGSYTVSKYLMADKQHYSTEYRLSSKVFALILAKYKCVNCFEFILRLNIDARIAMWDAMVEADGSMRRGSKRYDRFVSETNEVKNAGNIFNLLSVSLGKPIHSRNYKIRGQKDFTHYQLLMNDLTKQLHSKWKVERDASVWCPTTSLGTWIVRQGNLISITGNSGHNPNLQNQPRDKIVMKQLLFSELKLCKIIKQRREYISDKEFKQLLKDLKDNKEVEKFIDQYSIDIRKIFIPMPGRKFIGADYSQLELRMIAHLANDKLMCEKFRVGADIHQETADMISARVHRVVPRQDAKPLNFGLIYGLFWTSFAETTGMPKKEAKEVWETYFELFAGVTKFIGVVQKSARESHYVQTILGRRRNMDTVGINEWGDSKKDFMKRKNAENASVSTVVSGSSSDLIKIAMNEIYYKHKNDLDIKLQIHDELLIEVDEDKAEKMLPKIKSIMENAIKLRIPVLVEGKIGDSWRGVH